jgi:hypothetical protein
MTRSTRSSALTSVGSEHLAVSRSLVTLRRSRTVHGLVARLAERLRELAFRLPDEGDNAGNAAYVKLRTAATCGPPRPMLNVQLAIRFVPVMHPDSA